MGWTLGFDTTWNRDIGYGVPAICDHPDCNERIDRGLAYVCCNQQPYGGEDGCGLYFCEKHSDGGGKCEQCAADDLPFEPKPDLQEWIDFKLTDPSWETWRQAQVMHMTIDDVGLILLKDGWTQYDDVMHADSACFEKYYDTPTKCALNNKSYGIQVIIRVSDLFRNTHASYEIRLAGELSDGTWIGHHQWGIDCHISDGLKLIPRLLSTWEHAATYNQDGETGDAETG